MKKHILITEDDRFMANVCRRKFEEAGYQVSLAHDGNAAIEELVSHPPDVVLLDLMLPGIDGLGVLQFLRSRESLWDLPVIVVSNSDYFSGVVQAAWREGATHFLNKAACSPKSLVDEVNKVLDSAVPPPAEEASVNQPPHPRQLPERDRSAPIRVLLADDDKIIHSVLTFFMNQAGFVVRSAFDGRQALEMAQAEAPDIMVLDGLMPELNGSQVLEHWNMHPYLANIPVIMLTSLKDPSHKADALQNGVVEFLTKPFSPDALVDKISQYVGGAD